MNDFRIVAGIVSATTLNANAAAVVENFPVSDETDEWRVDTDGLISYPRVVRGADNQQRSLGKPRFGWKLHLTTSMYDYWIETVLEDKPSNIVTAQTYDSRRGLWLVFVTTINDGEITAERLNPRNGSFFLDVRFDFTGSVLAEE